MGKLARLVHGIKARLGKKKKEVAAPACYDKVEKMDSMRVEIRSRRAQKLIAKNLAAADTLGHGKKTEKRFFKV